MTFYETIKKMSYAKALRRKDAKVKTVQVSRKGAKDAKVKNNI